MKEKVPECHISLAGGAKLTISPRVRNGLASALATFTPPLTKNPGSAPAGIKTIKSTFSNTAIKKLEFRTIFLHKFNGVRQNGAQGATSQVLKVGPGG